MSEFRSQLEDLLPIEELLFDSTPGFGSVYSRFLSHSIAHPAKMNTRLTEFLIEKFTREGEVVLDPMAGSGQTGVISALRGRDSVCVELEEKFFGWMEKARKKVERQRTLAVKGKIRNVLGDARKLSQLLKEVDVVVTSPPYAEIFGVAHRSKLGNVKRQGSSYQEFGEQVHKKNIGNLPHGKIDAIVTSPPYSECPGSVYNGLGKKLEKLREDNKITKEQFNHFKGRKAFFEDGAESYPASEGQIAKLSHGSVDAVITSPPYADAKKGGEADEEKMAERWDKVAKERNWNTWGKTWKTEGRKRALKSLGSGYSKSEENIGNLPFADAVITSPPYEGQDLVMSGRSQMAERLTKAGYSEKEIKHHLSNAMSRKGKDTRDSYSASNANIGNLKKETYLEAMLKVYMEMYKVLKQNGKAIIIIKPFIRNKKVVDLPYHTWLLLKKAGFQLSKLFKLRLKTQSFWRILYNKKYPDVPQIQHEYILVCQKQR